MDHTSPYKPSQYLHWIDDQVRFSDLDPLGHVNNNAISQYFENARAIFYNLVTPSWPHRDEVFVLAKNTVTFLAELHMPAKIKIGTGVIKTGRTSLRLANTLVQDGKELAFSESVSVLINHKTRKPVAIDDEVRSKLEGYLLVG